MPIDFSRPTLTRDIPELTATQQGGMPSLGLQNVPTNVQGPNRFLQVLSDVLAGVSNPQQMRFQQQQRSQQLEDVFGRAQEAAGLRSRLAESTVQRQLAMQKMDEPEFRVDAKGNVTIINPRALRAGDFKKGVVRIEKAKELKPQAFEAKTAELENMFGIKLEPEEKASLFLAFQDSVEADDITPFRTVFGQIMTQRAAGARQERSLTAASERQERSLAAHQKLTVEELAARTTAVLEAKDEFQAKKELRKAEDSAGASDTLLRKMEDELAQIERTGTVSGPASMVLLSNHIAMTFGSVKGARVGRDIIEAHLAARSLPERIQVLAQQITQGGRISVDQAREFVNLARQKRFRDWQAVADAASRRGLQANVPLDVQRVIGPQTPPSTEGGGEAYPEGTVIRNPKTGERKIKKGGQWVQLSGK